MAKPFKIEKHSTIDKSFKIEGPDITLTVDYDDVNHKEVDKAARLIVAILNKNYEVRP